MFFTTRQKLEEIRQEILSLNNETFSHRMAIIDIRRQHEKLVSEIKESVKENPVAVKPVAAKPVALKKPKKK